MKLSDLYFIKYIVLFALLFCVHAGYAWPTYLHLKIGESQTIKIKNKTYLIELIGVEYISEPNNRKPPAIGSQTFKEARVTLSVNGAKTVLVQRAYQPPVEFKGLKLYVENTRKWTTDAGAFQKITDFPKDAKIALCAAEESWGPPAMRFPIRDYRWRTSLYNNTWSSLVPGGAVYYHHGEDYGAVPDQYHVQALLDGEVAATPLPNGDGQSNEIVVNVTPQFSYRLSHMNTSHVRPEVQLGARVEKGQLLAKTGATYQGEPKQNNPHLHVNFVYDGEAVSTYPYMVEAYLNEYPENILAVAGGYNYVIAGDSLELDASRSIARKGHKISSYTWKLHDGRTTKGAKTTLTYDKPGTYTEELIIKSPSGEEDRDYLQVYVFNTEKQPNDFLGYFYPMKVRDLKVGDEVILWCINKVKEPVLVDFGDGSAAIKAGMLTKHVYKKPGFYTVTFKSSNPSERPATAKMKLIVNP